MRPACCSRSPNSSPSPHEHGALPHTDAAQAVGKLPINVAEEVPRGGEPGHVHADLGDDDRGRDRPDAWDLIEPHRVRGERGQVRLDLGGQGGLRSVSVESKPLRIMLPPPGEFLWQYVTSTPLAGPVGEIGDDERAALERDVTTARRTFLDGDALRLDLDTVLTTARK